MRKRSQTLKLTTMLAGAASMSVAACDDAPQSIDWDTGKAEQVEALSYASLDACKAADDVPDAECETSYQAALKDDANAPRFTDTKSCEDIYGQGQCVPRGYGGSSFFTPLLAGFVIGRMLDGGGSPYYRGTGLYRRDGYYGGGGYATGWGGTLDRDYRTGRTVIARDALEAPTRVRTPTKVQSRTSVVSRGGFGGGSRGYGG
ncbi:MAG TPA: DUF1190 domain-containing protein [Phenylobacterium sp.]